MDVLTLTALRTDSLQCLILLGHLIRSHCTSLGVDMSDWWVIILIALFDERINVSVNIGNERRHNLEKRVK